MNKDLRRRLVELDEYVKRAIIVVNADRSTLPRNFGEYESWVIHMCTLIFRYKNPHIGFIKTDMMRLISGEFNQQLKEGYKGMK
jgi:hypothetical protein